jgi:hypothetical protein
VLLLSLLFPAAVVGYFWLVGYLALLLCWGGVVGTRPGWWLFAAYAAASFAVGFSLTRRRKLS